MKRLVLRLSLCLLILLLAGLSFTFAENELPKLGTATELIWGKECYKNTVDGPTIWVDQPGSASWKPAEFDLSRYRVITYNEQNEHVSTFWVTRGTEESECDYVCNKVFNWVDDIPSGRYYFTVQALGDGKTYADGDIAVSNYFEYIKPEQRCAKIDDIYWNGTTVYWTNVNETEGFLYYKYELYREDTLTETPTHQIAHGVTDWQQKDFSSRLTTPGYYYARVCVQTNDMSKYVQGPWARPSAPYFIGDKVSVENSHMKADINHSVSDLSAIATIAPLSEPVKLLAAGYDADGRFLGFDIKQIGSSKTEQTVSLTLGNQEAVEAKLLLLNEDLVPIDKALEASF